MALPPSIDRARAILGSMESDVPADDGARGAEHKGAGEEKGNAGMLESLLKEEAELGFERGQFSAAVTQEVPPPPPAPHWP
jgi:hypothetical protein